VYQIKEAHLKAKFRLQGLQGKASVKRISHVSKYYFVRANLMQTDPNTTSTGVRETWS
jgi:hypothetical protein